MIGRAEIAEEPRIRERFLTRHPKARLYAGFGDFAFWRLRIAGAHLNGGFARAMDLSGEQVMTDLAGAEELIGAEASAIEHMNADHREALSLYATRLAGAPDGNWQATGLDPEGLDLAAGDLTARAPFKRRVTEPTELRKMLKEMADEARATGL